MENKVSAVKLVRDFFAPITMEEMKALTPKDRVELASAIARQQGLTQDQVSFDLVDY